MTSPNGSQVSLMDTSYADGKNHSAEMWFHFVRHADVAGFEAKGWRTVNANIGHHSAYSVLMQWEGDGEPGS